MLVKFKIQEEPYVNLIELVYIFLLVEFHVAMATIKLFDINENKWNTRRLFWYSIMCLPATAIIAIYTIAAIKYIIS